MNISFREPTCFKNFVIVILPENITNELLMHEKIRIEMYQEYAKERVIKEGVISNTMIKRNFLTIKLHYFTINKIG